MHTTKEHIIALHIRGMELDLNIRGMDLALDIRGMDLNSPFLIYQKKNYVVASH